MEKKDLLEIWGCLDILKSYYQRRLLENNYSLKETKDIEQKMYERICKLQRLITAETESE